MTIEPTRNVVRRIAEQIGMDPGVLAGGSLEVRSPIDGDVIASIATTDASQLDGILDRALSAFL
jgi:aldehyde dehydrogenase (NAD+)